MEKGEIMTQFNFNMDKVTQNPIPVTNSTIEVSLNPHDLLSDYAKNFVAEGQRKHPLLSDKVALTAKEVYDYSLYLLKSRIEHVHGNFRNFRSQQLLFVPAWIEYTIANIGVLVVKELGLTFIPTFEVETITHDEAKLISDKIKMFEGTLQVVTTAFPKDINGDQDLMTTAIISDYVRSTKEIAHPVTTYLTAFLGLKLREENTFGILYRIQYDDISYLARALDSEGGVIC